MKAGWAAPAGVLLASALFMLPILYNRALPYGSDSGFATHSAWGFARSLESGVPYPRWVDNSNRGLGGPTFIFYCPLAYYAVAVTSLITGDLFLAFRLVLLAGALLAALACYLALRSLTGRAAAALGSAVYVLAPYHAIDLYDRFAYAEFMAFGWFPVIFLCVRRIVSRPTGGAWFGLALAYGGLCLTHLVTAFMVLFVLAPYVALRLFRARRMRPLLPLALAGTAGLLSAAVYLVPMVSQRAEVHTEFFVEAGYGDWRRNFVYRDETAHGFSPAPIKPWVNRAATTQAVVAGVAFLVLLVRRRAGAAPAEEVEEEGWAQALLAGWTFFLQLPLAAPVWAVVPELGTVQFPWRFSLFQALAAAMLCACAAAPRRTQAAAVGDEAPMTTRLPVQGLAAALLGLAFLPALFTSYRLASGASGKEFIMDGAAFSNPRVFARVMDEYLPRGFEGWRAFKTIPFALTSQARLVGRGTVDDTGWRALERRFQVRSRGPSRLLLPTFLRPGFSAWIDDRRVEVRPFEGGIELDIPPGEHEVRVRMADAALSGPGSLDIVHWSPERRDLRVETPEPTLLELRTFAYPGWQAEVDGRPVELSPGHPLHLVQVPVPAGRHDISVRFAATPDRRIGALVSFLTIATMLAYEWRRRRQVRA